MFLLAWLGECYDLSTLVAITLGLAVFWAVVLKIWDALFTYGWLPKQPWWQSNALVAQKIMLANFGVPEKQITDECCQDAYSFLALMAPHHFLCGLLQLPLVVGTLTAPDWSGGWAAASPAVRGAFVLGVLFNVSWDVFDFCRLFLRSFLHRQLGLMPMAPAAFIVMGCLHHPLSLAMSFPMLLYFRSMAEFPMIAVDLLFVASINCAIGAYKFSLTLSDAAEFFKFKILNFLYALTIVVARAFIFPPLAWWAIQKLRGDPAVSTAFMIGAYTAVGLIGLFNVLMIFDGVSVCAKWAFREMPKALQQEGAELQASASLGGAAGGASSSADFQKAASMLSTGSSVFSAVFEGEEEDAETVELMQDVASLSGSGVFFAPSSDSFTPGRRRRRRAAAGAGAEGSGCASEMASPEPGSPLRPGALAAALSDVFAPVDFDDGEADQHGTDKKND